ncbi:MAG TPA: hypothetical protein PLJ21_05330 [Pseudobdellovibrionaceae bacterium]|nr:hypothetical protein [Pseudobdellovibrionaceae bacterium]
MSIKFIYKFLVSSLFLNFIAESAIASPVVYVLNTETLQNLESSGFSINETLGQTKSLSRTSDLFKSNEVYRSFAETVGKPLPHDKKTDQLPDVIPENSGDIPDMVRLLRGFEDKGARSENDLKGGYIIRRVSNNSQHPYTVERDGDEPRHFDTRWLNSEYGYLKLVAIANRMDRSDITKDSCGEVRFIYRLSYKSKKSSSSLPFFLNVVHQYPKQESCAKFSKTWNIDSTDAKALKSGPLKNLSFRQMEVNFQSLRFTSGYMHDFGGQAMYMQRIFRKVGSRLEPVGLENTPDVLAIKKDPTLLKRFVEYLKKSENLNELDLGSLNINFDPKFLSKLSISWSTLGRARIANRPYAEIFRENRSLIESIDISKLKYIKSHDALIERLDNLTCMGCHQSGGTAGFHMLGFADASFSHPFNRQELALSPHASAEVSRRIAWLKNVANAQEPNHFRPHSTFSSSDWDVNLGIPKFANLNVGQLCIAEGGTYAMQPGCADPKGRPVECQKTVLSQGRKVLLGECVLKEAVNSAGSVCWSGEIKESSTAHLERNPPSFNFFAFEDKWKLSAGIVKDFKSYSCVLPQSGAPLGRMSRRCSLQEENFEVDFTNTVPDELCANQGGSGFDMCAASGDSGACLETKVARSMLDTCSESRSCREDYICQRFPDYSKISVKDYVRKKGTQLINLSQPNKIRGHVIEEARRRGLGFCVPTYFLFNMRLDGHPSPMTGLPPGVPNYDRSQPLRGYK